jgi:hypothetical protein
MFSYLFAMSILVKNREKKRTPQKHTKSWGIVIAELANLREKKCRNLHICGANLRDFFFNFPLAKPQEVEFEFDDFQLPVL